MKRITSRHHPLVARCRALARAGGDAGGLVLLDGAHLVEEAQSAGLPIETAAVSDGYLERQGGSQLAARLAQCSAEVVTVSDHVMEAISPVSTPSGIVAIARRPLASLAEVFASPHQLVLMGADIQDPGNVGAMARAAEAAGATGFVLCGASASPLGWKALRGSMGSLLRLPTASTAVWRDAIAAARTAGATVMATSPRATLTLYEVDLRTPVAFLLGGEGPGLPEEAIEHADLTLSIPMRGPVESLNVSVAAALLVFEAARQRARP